MAHLMRFKEGETLIGQGEEDTAAYLIQSGWLEVHRILTDGSVQVKTLQAGDVVGELGLAGLARQRTATVIALTDGEVEVIDRGTLIRLVNMPGGAITPLLAALFSRLQNMLIENDPPELEDTLISYAKLEGRNALGKQTLCNQARIIGHLPWVMGAYRVPQTVTDLFKDPTKLDVRLTGCSLLIHEEHVIIEASEDGGLQLRVVNFGSHCHLNGERIVNDSNHSGIAPLPVGEYTLAFGDPGNHFEFSLDVYM